MQNYASPVLKIASNVICILCPENCKQSLLEIFRTEYVEFYMKSISYYITVLLIDSLLNHKTRIVKTDILR